MQRDNDERLFPIQLRDASHLMTQRVHQRIFLFKSSRLLLLLLDFRTFSREFHFFIWEWKFYADVYEAMSSSNHEQVKEFCSCVHWKLFKFIENQWVFKLNAQLVSWSFYHRQDISNQSFWMKINLNFIGKRIVSTSPDVQTSDVFGPWVL